MRFDQEVKIQDAGQQVNNQTTNSLESAQHEVKNDT
jgi:hypothetical protein